MKRLAAIVLALVMVFALCACGASSPAPATGSNAPAATFTPDTNSVLNTKVLRVGMECAYAPYNWTQPDNANGAVPIHGSSEFVNGYDVMMAQKICEANGWTLDVYKMDWDSIPLAVQSGAIDCGICGQSITPERLESMDFSAPYYYASIVTLVKADGKYASATGISGLAGTTCTSQINTVWYDTCLPQLKNANILAAQDTSGSMLIALESGACDLVCTDQPTAMAACVAYPDLKMLDFTNTSDNYAVDEGDVNIGVSIKKGNSQLVDACNSVLTKLTADDFTALMQSAIKIQPLNA